MNATADANKIVVRVRVSIGLRLPRGGGGDSRSSRTSDESAAVSLAFDFKKGADKKVGRKFFDRKANGVSSARESPVPK